MPLRLVPPAKSTPDTDPHHSVLDAIEEVERAISEGRDTEARLWLRVVKKLSVEMRTRIALMGYGAKR